MALRFLYPKWKTRILIVGLLFLIAGLSLVLQNSLGFLSHEAGFLVLYIGCGLFFMRWRGAEELLFVVFWPLGLIRLAFRKNLPTDWYGYLKSRTKRVYQQSLETGTVLSILIYASAAALLLYGWFHLGKPSSLSDLLEVTSSLTFCILGGLLLLGCFVGVMLYFLVVIMSFFPVLRIIERWVGVFQPSDLEKTKLELEEKLNMRQRSRRNNPSRKRSKFIGSKLHNRMR